MRQDDTNCENVPQRGKKDIWWFPVKDTSVSDWGMGEGESAAGDICLSEKHFTTHSVSLTLPSENRTAVIEVCLAQQLSLREHQTIAENTELLSQLSEN